MYFLEGLSFTSRDLFVNATKRVVWFSSLLFLWFLGGGGRHTKPTREGAKLGWVTCRACRGPGERRTREPNIQMHGGHAGGPRENLRVGKFRQE